MNRIVNVGRLVSIAALLAARLTAQTALTTELVADGFLQPLQVVQAPGDDHRLFVVEEGGRIAVIHDGLVLATPFLDLSGAVSSGQGLIGLAFHPDYATNGYFYVNTTSQEVSPRATHIVRYSVSADPSVADAGSAFEILTFKQPFHDHNGGDLKFGPDGYLYIPFGDGGAPGDPGCRSQNGMEFLGKIVRLDVDGGSPYAIPPTNPYIGDPTHLDEIWAKGLRNPFRFSFDRVTGDVYIGDVGQVTREEINFQPAGLGGLNYGWKVMEGSTCFDPDPLDVDCLASTESCFSAEFTAPIHELDTQLSCSVIGGFVYRGCAIPDLQGAYVFGDYCSADIWSFRWDGGNMTELAERTAELAPGGGVAIDDITSFGEDNDGELYIVDRGGEVFKIVPVAPEPAVDLGFGLAASSGVTAELDACGILEEGNTAEFRLRSAPANSAALLIVSTTEAQVPIYSGVLVPGFPFAFTDGFVTDADGEIRIEAVDGGLFGSPLDLAMQYLILDPALPEQVAFSNAIRASWQ